MRMKEPVIYPGFDSILHENDQTETHKNRLNKTPWFINKVNSEEKNIINIIQKLKINENIATAQDLSDKRKRVLNEYLGKLKLELNTMDWTTNEIHYLVDVLCEKMYKYINKLYISDLVEDSSYNKK